MMRLGLVITDETYTAPVTDLAERALARGWEVRCFLTDTGVRALADKRFSALLATGGPKTAVCETSIERHGTGGPELEALESMVIVGGQYQNAELVRESDAVLAF